MSWFRSFGGYFDCAAGFYCQCGSEWRDQWRKWMCVAVKSRFRERRGCPFGVA